MSFPEISASGPELMPVTGNKFRKIQAGLRAETIPDGRIK
jgi:hypothetical protein